MVSSPAPHARISARTRFDVVNPATGTIAGDVPENTAADLDIAMEAADEAFVTWSRDAEGRRESLLALADLLLANHLELARLTTLEQGKPLAEAIAEVQAAAMILQYSASVSLPTEVLHDDASARVELRRKPIGPVVAITPWNAPLYMLAMKMGPALSAGNTVVAKPSPVTPLATLAFGELTRGVLPQGVFAVLTDTGDLGQRMVAHPLTRKISFTGSIDIGRLVAVGAAHDLKRVTLELGGNDPAIVLPGADLDHAAAGLAQMAFGNAGQVCVAPKRIYVHDSQYGELVERLAVAADRVRVGNGLDDGVQMGPLTTPQQRSHVEELLADARTRGGRVVTGGTRLGGDGYFLTPAVVADVPDDARLVTEEQFGPAIPVLSYREVRDAVNRANDTHYGLGASVWGSDRELLDDVGSRLEAGQIWINTHRAVATVAQPVVGLKWSGIGAENGRIGVLDFSDAQVYFEAKAAHA